MFINSDDTFANVRRFGRLSARLILHLQNDLTNLEASIDELDKADAASPTTKARLHGYEKFKGQTTEQRDLLHNARLKYLEYSMKKFG